MAREAVYMFYKKSTTGYKEILPGIKMKALAFGTKTLLSEFKLKMGTVIPEHRHLHEQTGYLVSGAINLTIGDEIFEVVPGDSWCIESNTPHSVHVIENSLIVEVFSPVREEYLPKNM